MTILMSSAFWRGFAFLAARIHRRIDDDYLQISQSLLNLVYPHYLRPIPSMSVVEFRPDPDQGGPSSGFLIEAGRNLVAPPTKGVRCRFKTCYDTTLWPIEVVGAKWQAPHELEIGGHTRDLAAGLRLRLKCQGDLTFKDLGDLPEHSVLSERRPRAGLRSVRGSGQQLHRNSPPGRRCR